MILVLDCETTGLPRDYQAPVTDLDNWPRTVQIAWATFENNGQVIENYSFIIRPDGFVIPPEATAKHGITQEMAIHRGASLESVLLMLETCLKHADFVVAHNIDFDSAVLGSEFLRIENFNPFDGKRLICTMKESTEYCALGNGRNGQYKWPKLSELFATLFPGDEILKEHDAGNDVATCARCFFKLVELGVIVIPSDEIFTLPQGSDIQKLAQVRQTLAGLQATKQAMLDTVLKDVVYIGIEKQITHMKVLQDAWSSRIRDEGLAQFLKDKVKRPEGAGYQVKEFKNGKLTYTPETALNYCLTDLKAALALDVKTFENIAKTGKLPATIVKVEDDYRVQIDSDLSEFLPSDDDDEEIPPGDHEGRLAVEGDDIPF